MNNEVKVRNFEKGRVAVVNHKGSLKEFNLVFERVNKWIKNNNFKATNNHYLRFHPEYGDFSSNNIVFELGIPVENQSNNNPVKIVNIPEREVISALYKGPYFNLPSIHGILEDYARKNDLAPMDSPTEIYFNDPLEVKSDDLLTEVQFTVLDFKVENIPYVPLFNEIERKIIKRQKMVVMEHYGSVEDLYKVRVDLVKWAEKHDIKIDAVYFKFNLSFDGISPEGVVFRVGIPVNDNFKGNGMIEIVEIPEHEVLSAVYKGPYINIPNVTRMMVDYAFENGLELIDFAEEIYLNSIFDVSCDDLLTEVRMQVIDFNFDRNIPLERKIERKVIEKHEIASIRQVGSFEKINKIKTDLFNWLEKQNIKTIGPHFLRFHNHPRSLTPENICYEIGVYLDSTIEDLIKVRDYPRHIALSLNHNGPISTLKDTHDFLKNYAEENRFIPFDFPINLFIDKIPENNKEELLIKAILPVKKL